MVLAGELLPATCGSLAFQAAASARVDVASINAYRMALGRHVIALLLYSVTVVALLALLLGVGWLVWDYLMNHSMPYNDPEAIEAVRRTLLV
jgi:hypothetical protein